MAEYIDREAAISLIKQYGHDAIDGGRYSLDTVDDCIELANRIEALPTEDVAPVVHGRWEYTPQMFNTLGQIRCPFCAWWSLDQSIDGVYKYCPNCGAKMGIKDGGDSDETD